jgi:hypothetical protein
MRFKSIFFALLLYSKIFAQNSIVPLSTDINSIPKLSIKKINSDSLLAVIGQKLNDEKMPLKFAEKYEQTVNILSEGRTQIINNKKVISYRIQSRSAKNINLGFTKYKLPKEANLLIYNIRKSDIIGPFSVNDNEFHEQFWSPIIDGDDIIIELQVPVTNNENIELELSYINHGFRKFNAREGIFERSGACNVDVACPQADFYRDIIRSSAMYTINGTETCSGALINNTSNDNRPYYLTANHCGINTTNAASIVAYWKYQNSTCRTPGSTESGQTGDGTLNMYNTGAILRAKSAVSDFCLIEFDDPINVNYGLFWSGWNKKNIPPTKATIIHHPNTEEMRITLSSIYNYNVSNYSGNIPGDSSHINVTGYDIGTTEGGSSGAPIYDQNKRIVGQLHGGPASCANNAGDYYGWLYKSWNGEGTVSTRLKDWLDPQQTGIEFINGLDALPLNPLDIAFQNLNGISNSIQTCINNFSPSVSFTNNGATTIQTLTIKYTLDGTTHDIIWNGELTSYNSITFNLPQIQLNTGFHTYSVSLENPNGIADNISNNNSPIYNFTIVDGRTITINLLTDDYPAETSLYIYDEQNNEVYSQSNFNNRASLYSIPVCLATGCYTFEIKDSQSDGICCNYGNGSISVNNPEGVLINSNTNFMSQSWTLPFCITSVDGVEDNIKENIQVFPSPASNKIFIKQNLGINKIENISLINMLGEIVFFTNNFTSDYININEFNNGIYIMKIEVEKNIFTYKTIIRK